MDKNTVIGLTLIFLLLLVWQQFMTPSAAEIQARRHAQDSLARAQQLADSLTRIAGAASITGQEAPAQEVDSAKAARLAGAYGPFAQAAAGEEKLETLENDLIKITFSNKGGRIREVLLKQHYKVAEDEKKREIKSPLRLLEDEKNRFEYFLPVAGLPNGGVNTADLYFAASKTGDAVTFRTDAGGGRYFEQTYAISPDGYKIDYRIRFEGLHEIIPPNADAVQLTWINYLDHLEKNVSYERNYSTIYYKPADDDVDYCSCTRDDSEELGGSVKWISHSNQFFSSALMAEQSFRSAKLETVVLPLNDPDLKRLESRLAIPYNRTGSETFAMTLYVGPNEFTRLQAMGHNLEDVIPFGWSIFGTINRWVIRPLFNFLSTFIANKGLVILALTLIVKILLYPLSYRMLYSQSKMGVLKPQLESMRERFKDDPQKQQLEQMKVYREFGVNPLGGCLPMLLQMPIWFALYRFFPAAIEFRQASFLWATDLSSYDVFARLPFEIPFGFGSHISLFTLLWAITTLIYTYYSTRHMDLSANPAMKYMQYIMPLFFLGFFNSFASGLTAYLLFSNLINIGQTIATKNFIIDEDKIREALEANRRKPKKKGGFQERLESAMKEQQRIQAERESAAKKRGKK